MQVLINEALLVSVPPEQVPSLGDHLAQQVAHVHTSLSAGSRATHPQDQLLHDLKTAMGHAPFAAWLAGAPHLAGLVGIALQVDTELRGRAEDKNFLAALNKICATTTLPPESAVLLQKNGAVSGADLTQHADDLYLAIVSGDLVLAQRIALGFTLLFAHVATRLAAFLETAQAPSRGLGRLWKRPSRTEMDTLAKKEMSSAWALQLELRAEKLQEVLAPALTQQEAGC